MVKEKDHVQRKKYEKYEGISMTNFSNLKVKREKSNLKYTESKLVQKRPR